MTIMSALDGSIFQWLFHIQEFSKLSFLVRAFGVYTLWVMAIGFLVLLFYEESRRKKVYVLVFSFLLVLLSRGIITEIVRAFYKKPRPFSVFNITPLSQGITSPAFPSGHTVIMFAIAFSVLLLGNKKWMWIAFILASLGAIARVMMGIHWPADIVGGALLSAVVFVLFYFWLLPPKLAKAKKVDSADISESI